MEEEKNKNDIEELLERANEQNIDDSNNEKSFKEDSHTDRSSKDNSFNEDSYKESDHKDNSYNDKSLDERSSKDQNQDRDEESGEFESSDSSSRGRKKNLHCQIALVDCDNITVTCKEQVRDVSEIFIEDNIAWVHLEGDSGITEIDCAYGICHYIPSWSMEAEDTVSASRSDGTMALGRCIAALLRIYIDKDLQDPGIMEERVSAQEGPVLSHYGIQLRFAKRQLKLVRNKKFLTLLQAAEALRRASGDVIVEEIDG